MVSITKMQQAVIYDFFTCMFLDKREDSNWE